MTEEGFKKCGSDNIAKIDSFMVARFFAGNENFCSAEMRCVKVNRSSRESYGDSAVGYVQVKRENKCCIMKGKITPEHRVRNKAYSVCLKIDEERNDIISSECFGCAASKGGCKHSVAFLMWAHRRSEEPAPTSVQCYWKRSKLAQVGTVVKFVEVKDFKPKQTSRRNLHLKQTSPTDENFLEEFKMHALTNSSQCQLLKHLVPMENIESCSIDQLLYEYQDQGGNMVSTEQFITFCTEKMTSLDLASATVMTKDQSDSSLWFRLRYGRITASKLYAASRCHTENGSLVESIFGAKKFKPTNQMKRGIELEPMVIKEVQKKTGLKLHQVGLFLNKDYPMLGASPDSVSEEYVIEIKCPSTMTTMLKYVKNNEVDKKYMAQMHLQMLFAKKKKALFCLADTEFEKTKKVEIHEVQYDEYFANSVINDAIKFWKKSVCPILMKNSGTL